mmetsp:Transcript_15838/g.37024  ORF Transcript_15838/g.37024 Transcript_15838/m.37024 type:complete len:107 (+) Transcript_15838:866-1186(+)
MHHQSQSARTRWYLAQRADCLGLGFDGRTLLATPWARDALSRRRIIVRPDKYAIRGEWFTEARLYKYAMRGFHVVDRGIRTDASVPCHSPLQFAAARASGDLHRRV